MPALQPRSCCRARWHTPAAPCAAPVPPAGLAQFLPGEDAYRTFLVASYRELNRSGPQDLANTAWAFAKLGLAPEAEWTDRCVLARLARLCAARLRVPRASRLAAELARGAGLLALVCWRGR
jgi:hypothetical protein